MITIRDPVFAINVSLLCLFAVGVDSPAQAERRPNIVILLADDLGYADVGFHGCRDIPTPHIDALARGGVRFTNAYVSGPYCSPTRAGLLTGRYQQRFGHEFNPGGRGGAAAIGLPVAETTMAERLRDAGYATALVGKWHLGAARQFHPQQRGFDEFFGFLEGAHTYFPDESARLKRGTETIREPEYLTDAIARESVDFIERHRERPFFLYVSFNAVHTPMHATDDRLARFNHIDDRQRRIYAAMTLALDEAIGRIMQKLAQAGLDDDTLVFFFSDNGGPTMRGTTLNASSNAPLRGSKRTTLEGGIRVPFVMRWPGKLPADASRDQPVIQLDVLPTALSAAGLQIDPEWQLDGVNLLPYARGDSSEAPHDTLYWRFGAQMALRQGPWKLVRYDLAADDRAGEGTSELQLYNLHDDIGEAHNLAQREPQRVEALLQLWQSWNEQLVDPLWGGGVESQLRRARSQ